jgi:hemolysin D
LIARQPLIERSREAVGKLFDRNMAAEQEYIRVKLESIETTYAIEAAREAVLMHQAQIEETRREVESLLSSARRDWLAQLMQTRLRKAQLNLERGQLDLRIADLLLRAPVGGSVEELQIHAVDAVVDAAQPLMKLVPWPRAMEIEARLNDRDAGFVVAGHAAKIKVDAFPYTRFGTLQGVVSRIAAESATDESGTSSYRLRVTPSAESLARWSETASLLPGMRVSVEIRTGQRRLIEFFLSPILRYRDESLHER